MWGRAILYKTRAMTLNLPKMKLSRLVFFKEHLFPFLDADVFAHHHQPRVARHIVWLVAELRHALAHRLFIQVAP